MRMLSFIWIFIILAACAVVFAIQYLIIKAAVRNGIRESDMREEDRRDRSIKLDAVPRLTIGVGMVALIFFTLLAIGI